MIHETEKGILLSVRVQPNAKKAGFSGIWNGTHIRISLSEPAVDGRANDALIEFLSDVFSVKKKQIIIQSGLTSRQKVVLLSVSDVSDRKEIVEKWQKLKLSMENP